MAAVRRAQPWGFSHRPHEGAVTRGLRMV